MRCPKCQSENSDRARFCCECGEKLQQACANCGAAHVPGANFCGECGHKIGAPISAKATTKGEPSQLSHVAAGREERRWATLLFADLSGFTGMSEQMDPEDVKALAQRCSERLSEEVRRFGGMVVAIAGDQVVAVFGAPVAHEDDAERGVRAALAMRDCPLHDDFGKPIKIHAGLNTGEVMAGLLGPDKQQDYVVMGDTTNVASRIMSAAPTGCVLVGEETWRATKEVIRYRKLPPIVAKGKQQPVQVWEALDAVAAPKSRPLGTAPLVGRDEELGLLSAIWLRVVREARPHLVTLQGDPGLGKSRLVAEFEKRFCADARVLHGRCLPYGEALSYWALASALKEAAGIASELDPSAARAQLENSAQDVLSKDGMADPSEIVRHLAVVSGLETVQNTPGTTLDQPTLHASVRKYFQALARQQPLCWMVEDIHWADDALLDLIELVARRAEGVPLLILAQARPTLLEKRPNWGAGVSGFTSLALEALGPDQAHELVLALCRERGLPESVARQVWQGAGGNPLFAEELVAMIAERGHGAGIPSAIKLLIAARLDALPAAERSTLQLAAVFGKVFWTGGLRALGADANVARQLEALEERDLLRSQPRSQFRNETEFAFKHDLIRDVAYEMIPRTERRGLHGKIAGWIEMVAAGNLDNYLDQLAHHTVNAGQEERAVGFLTEAAERARQVAAHRQEAALLAEAIEIAERLGRFEQAGELRARRGTALERVGMWAEARPELEKALTQLPQEPAVRRAEVLLTLTGICYWVFDLPAMRSCISEAGALAEKIGRRDLIAEANGWLAASKSADGDVLGAVELFRKALRDPGVRVVPLALYSGTLYMLGRAEEALEVGRDLVSRLRGQADTVSTMFAYPHLGLALAACGRYDEALRVFDEARRFGQEYQIRPFLARSVSMSAGFHLDLFNFAQNEVLNEEAREMGLVNSFPPTVISACIDLLLNYARTHEVGRAESLIETTEQAMVGIRGWHRWIWSLRLAEARAEIALVRGNFADAIRLAGEAMTESQARGRLKYELLARWTRARASAALGKKAEAATELRHAIQLTSSKGDPAMFLRLAAALLAIEGTDELAAEAGAAVKQIAMVLTDRGMRERFEEAEPVRLARKLSGVTASDA